MNLQEILAGGGISLFVLLTLVQIAPIKVSPWSAIAKGIGKALNADVLKELEEVKTAQKETQKKLDEHIRTDAERDANMHRNRILQFSNELLREIPHSHEEFIETLTEVDEYERYCAGHPSYENNRAVCAIDTIKRVYKERLEKHDFLQ